VQARLLLSTWLGHVDPKSTYAPLITAFLRHLQTGRANSITPRNARLAAIRSLFRYAALRAPEHAAVSARSWPSRPNAATGP
jgi:hypothetical protein